MKTINHEQKINDIVGLFRTDCIRFLDKALKSGMVPQEMIDTDNYILAKAIVDSMMRDRPYYLANHKKEFDNINSI